MSISAGRPTGEGNHPPLEEALEPVATALAADGYGLEAARVDDDVVIRIVAGPDACDDCLSPRTVMEPMIRELLAEAGLDGTGLRLSYPGEPGPTELSMTT